MHLFLRHIAGVWRKSPGSGPEGVVPIDGPGEMPGPSVSAWPDIQFSSGDDEVMLSDLWQGYQEATSLENGQRAFEAFLMSFIRVYENWTPTENPVPLSQLHPTDVPPRPVYGEGLFGTPLLQGGQGDVIIGCASGHPTRVILGLVQELKMVRKMIAQASVSQDDVELKLRDAEENAFGLSLLHALNIATRSAHNRRIFVFYEGFGNLMRLMKAAVIQVKAVATAMTSDRNPSSLIFTQLTFLQLLLAHVISIVANFVEAELNHQSRYSETRSSSPRSRPGSGSWGIGIGAADTLSYPGSAGSSRPSSRPASPRHRHYGGGSGNASPVNPHFTSMESVPLLETNGLNWCVELLRILRRLRVEGLLNDSALERLTLRTLRSAIACSYRVQNHFRSIGGLDVLLDGLGWPSLRGLFRERLSAGHLPGEDDRIAGQLEAEFQMQLLSLRVIREAVYRNTMSLQRICDNSGFSKLVKLFRWTVCTFLETPTDAAGVVKPGFLDTFFAANRLVLPLPHSSPNFQEDDIVGLNSHLAELSTVLWSFVCLPEHDLQTLGWASEGVLSSGPISSYWELANRVLIGMLLDVFREKKGDTREDQEALLLMRSRTATPQMYVLNIFKQVLRLSPNSIMFFREYHAWEVMCSECFFYFGCPFVCPSSGRDYSSSGDLRMREDDLRARSSSGEVRSVDFRSGELRSGELRSGELRMGGDFRSGELRSGELRSGEVRVRGDSGYPGLWTEIMLGQSDGDWERDSGEVRELPDSLEAESLRVEVISLLEAAATLEGITFNQRECLALMSTLYKCALVPSVAAVLARCLHRVLQLAVDATVDAMLQYDMTTMLSRIMMKQHETHSLVRKSEADEAEVEPQPAEAKRTYRSNSLVADQWWQARTTVFTLFKDYIALSDEARVRAGQNETAINVLFELLWEPNARKFALRHILTFMKRLPQLGEDRAVKLSLFGKYLEALPRAQVECRGSGTIDILNDLLEGIQDVLQVDLKYYQGLFAEGECFVQIVSVLNSEHSFEAGSKLTLNVIKTLTKLLSGNDTTKAVFRNLVGAGYHTLSKVIIERHHGCPSRELLGALLDMLVDGRFDVRSNMVIQNEDVVPLFFGVLRKCDVNLQLEGLDTFQALLDECTSNRACCVRAGLVGILLEWFPSIEDDILLDKVAILVRMSGGHSVSGKDMRVVFGLLRSTREGCRPRHATALLRTLQSMVAGEGPAVFYEFSGRESGISLSSPLRWPVSKGYTFCCWLRVEHFLRKDHAGSVYDGAMGLFSFTIDRGKGSDHMKGCTALIFESGLSVQTHGSKAQTVRMDFQFRPKRWYFVVVAHSVSRLVGGSNIKFYVDGNLVTSEKLRYPKINDPVTRCTIAAKAPLPLSEDCENNEDMAPHKMSSAFRGQLGPIYLFDDALSSNQVAGVARLGPGYMYSFLPNESGCVPENVSVHGIMDGKDGLAPRMVFGFNAQASSGKTCFNISALLDQGSDQLPCDATIMEGTQVCCTRRVQDIIHCVGGITVLFPLFTQLDQPVVGSTEAFAENKSGFEEGHKKQGDAKGERRSCFHEAVKGSEVATARSQMEYKVDQYLAVEVIGLLAAVLAGNLANQQYMLNMAGFAVVGFLLQRVSPQHLTVNVVHALERLIGSVANSPAPSVADALVKEALSKLYLDPRIWVYTPFEVQKELYQSLLRQVDHDPGRLRITCGLQRVLDIVRQFYWDKPCSSQSYATRPLLHPVTHIRIGERPSSQEVAKLRTMVLGLADRMFRENVSLVEVKALVAFIEKGIDNSLIEDVLRCVLSVLNYKGPALAAMVEHVFALGGCQIFLSILKRDQESIRLLGLRLIGTILTATPVEKRVGRVNTGSSGALAALERIRGTEKASISTLFAAIGENISFFPFTEALRTTLFELMLGGASQKQALDASHVLDASHEQMHGTWQATSQSLETLTGSCPQLLARSPRILAGAPTMPSLKTTPPDMELPAVMGIICKFLRGCEDYQLHIDILKDIAHLVVENSHNRELLIQEAVWQEWLFSLLGDAHSKRDKAALFSSSRKDMPSDAAAEAMQEESLIRKVFTSVLTYCVCQKKGGWKDVERTISFVHMISEREILQGFFVMHDLLADLLESVLQECPNQVSLMTQPCRDNTLYILALVDELVMKDTVRYLPAVGDTRPEDKDSISLSGGGYGLASLLKPGSRRFSLGDQIASTAQELPPPICSRRMSGIRESARGWHKETVGASSHSISRDKCWRLYNQVWVLLEMMNGRARGAAFAASDSVVLMGGSSGVASGSGLAGLVPPPTIGQRARCLVESINAPAAEVAAAVSGSFGAVVGGGISGITSKGSDKAMKMRGEKCPRVVFRLVLLYLHEADLESAAKCKNQFLSLLPDLLSVENEANKNRLQLFLRALHHAKSLVGFMDDGARGNLILQLIQKTSEHFRSMVATTVDKERRGKDDLEDEEDSMQSLQHDKVAAALKDEMKYISQAQKQRMNDVEALKAELDEASAAESQQLRAMEEQRQTVLATIVNAETARRSALQLAIDEEQQAIVRHWCHMFRGLTDERGPWAPGPSPGDPPLRWKLDKTEDPWRRRMRLKRNYHFDENLVAPTNPLPPLKKPHSEGDQDEGAGEKESSEPAGGGIRHVLLTGLMGVKQKGVVEVSGTDDPSGKGDFGEAEVDNAALVAGAGAAVMAAANDELEKRQQSGSGAETSGSSLEDDKVFVSLLSVLITPKRKVAGRLELMRKHLIFHGEMTVEGSAGSSVFEMMTSGEGPYEGTAGLGQKKADRKVRDSYDGNDKPRSPEQRWEGFLKGGLPRGGSATVSSSMSMALNMMDAPKDVVKRHRRWAFSQVKEVHLMRYLLRYTAVEVFFHQATPPVFFNFQSVKHAKEAAHKIAQLANSARGSGGDRDGMGGTVIVIDKKKAMELAEKAKERWRRREMTTFDYLMTLNTLAGRSYNDLTQYPVFPWIVADYASSVLDLDNPASFRDLSKPVGALNEKRLQTFEERYNNFTDPSIPSFYYGSHYSSAGIVLFYLIRLEPFTTLHRHLQGGKFDHADRLFHSVESAYSNCLTNTSDVKELVPEFFYLPEFLSNSNTYFLGVKQDGEVLGNVMLPPWAEGSPETFVRKNREALESDIVSDHLHEWVDLIFGFKQRGAAAVGAANVFYYLTYEGSVNLDQIEDKTQKASIEDQIFNFGQTPIQLFKRKHLKRMGCMPLSRPLYYVPDSIMITGKASPTSSSNTPVQQPAGLIFVGLTDGRIVTVNSRQMMSSRQWIAPNTMPGGGTFTFSAQDIFFSVGPELSPPRKIGTPFGEVNVSSSYFDTLRVGSSALLLTCGHWDNSFKCISIEDGKMVQSICQHKDVVTCISVSSDGSVVATGSRDTTVMVWETEQANEKGSGRVGFRESLGYGGGSHHGRGEKELVVISDKPRRVLCGHDDAVNTVAVMTEFDMVVSGSEDGTCIFHTLKHGRYLRSVKHPNGGSIDRVVVSKQGPVVMYSRYDLTLHSFSLNGKHLASAEANGRVSCMDLSACGEFVVTCGDKGVVIVRWVHSLEVVKRYEGTGVPMTSLAVTMEDCFLVGLQDGAILLYSIEHTQMRKTSNIFALPGRFQAGVIREMRRQKGRHKKEITVPVPARAPPVPSGPLSSSWPSSSAALTSLLPSQPSA